MRLSLLIEPEDGVRYDTIARLAGHAELLGFEALYVSDHYESVFGWHGVGAPDSWGLLAALARDTRRIAIGTLVSPVTLRRFSTLSKLVATVGFVAGESYVLHVPSDDGGISEQPRVHLGLGAGWLESEHRHVGIPFPCARIRVDMLEEQLRALHAIWDPAAEPVAIDGEHVALTDMQFVPRPHPRPRIIVGGKGKVRMPRIAASYADEFSVPFVTPDELEILRNAVGDACREVRRDPATMTLSMKKGILVGSDARELQQRAKRMQYLAGDGRSTREYLGWLRNRWIVGLPDEAASAISHLRAAGVQRLILQHLLPDDLSMLDLIAQKVAKPCGGSPDTHRGDQPLRPERMNHDLRPL